MNKVKFGFIGAGLIARIGLYPAFQNSQYADIAAVASRDINRAKMLSPNGKVYTNYEDLINDPEIEAVYISLPNSLHIPWSIKAMQAGKHVLCEKPIAMNAKELKEAIKVSESTGKLLMEASWNRWHPRTIRIKELVDSGIIGSIIKIDSAVTYQGLNDINNIRTTPELGGGSLYDLGPYSTVAPLWILDFAPVTDIETEVTWHPGGCDETLITKYKINDIDITTMVSMNIPTLDMINITGTKGRIYANYDAFFSYNNFSNLTISDKDGRIVSEEFEPCDPYQLMLDSFSRAIRQEKAFLLPIEQSLKFSQFFDQIREKMNEKK